MLTFDTRTLRDGGDGGDSEGDGDDGDVVG